MNERSAYQATNQRGRLTTSIIRNEYSIKPISPPITPPPFHKKSIDNHHHHLSSPYSISSSIIQDKGFQTSAVRNARPAYSNAPFPLRITIPVTPPLKNPPMRGLMAPPPLVFPHHQVHPSQPPQHLLQPPYPLQPVLESSLPATMIPIDSHLSFTFGQMPPLPQSAMLRYPAYCCSSNNNATTTTNGSIKCSDAGHPFACVPSPGQGRCCTTFVFTCASEGPQNGIQRSRRTERYQYWTDSESHAQY